MDIRFFDHNATTPLWAEARAAWLEASDLYWWNPSSPYRKGASVKVRLEAAREGIAEVCGVRPERLMFNSGATEGNNAVFTYWASCLPADARIGVSPVEHPSVLEVAKVVFKDRIIWLELDASGAVDLSALESLVRSGKVAAVSMMASNNETGVLHDWQAAARFCRAAGVLYHCDASQWIGKRALSGLADCDFVTGCAHKFGGPKGVGFLILPENSTAFCSLRGGTQEFGYRAGTEDVAGVLAMRVALERANASVPRDASGWRDDFVAQLLEEFPAAVLVGGKAERMWNTVSVIMPEFDSVRWVRGLERRGILVSAGSACSTGKQGPSHVLAAMGYDPLAMRRVIRISSGWQATESDWSALLRGFKETHQALRAEAEGGGSRVIDI